MRHRIFLDFHISPNKSCKVYLLKQISTWMPPKKYNKKKAEEEEDKLFEKKEKQVSKWQQALEEEEEQQPQELIQKKPIYAHFTNETVFMKEQREREEKRQEKEREKERERLKKLKEEQEQQERLKEPPRELTDAEKEELAKKEEIRKEKERKKAEKKVREKEEKEKQKQEEKAEKERQAETEKLIEANSKMPQKNDTFKVFVILAVLVVGLGFLQYQGEIYQRYRAFSPGESQVDLYQVLEADSGLNDLELKAKYKKLVLKYHPDKNKECHDCKQRFAEIVKAWEVLGEPLKRKEYDQNHGVLTSIKSSSLTLTQNNYHLQVEDSDELWIIQVFDSTDTFCHRYSQIWEEVVEKYKGFVKFGRIDVWTQKDMLAHVPYSFTFYPSIYSLYKGHSDIYSLDLKKPVESLAAFIESQITYEIPRLKDITELTSRADVKYPALMIGMRRLQVPYQIKVIAQRYKDLLGVYIYDAKDEPGSAGTKFRGAHVYLSADQSQHIEFSLNHKGIQHLDSIIKTFITRKLSICKLLDSCSEESCLIILDKNAKVPRSQYPKVEVVDPEFYQELKAMKNRTMQRQSFEVGLFLDGKITLGYVDEIKELTIDDGEILDLQCRVKPSINYARIGMLALVAFVAVKIQSRILRASIAGYFLYLGFQYSRSVGLI